jgi:hypothetical protein
MQGVSRRIKTSARTALDSGNRWGRDVQFEIVRIEAVHVSSRNELMFGKDSGGLRTGIQKVHGDAHDGFTVRFREESNGANQVCPAPAQFSARFDCAPLPDNRIGILPPGLFEGSQGAQSARIVYGSEQNASGPRCF